MFPSGHILCRQVCTFKKGFKLDDPIILVERYPQEEEWKNVEASAGKIKLSVKDILAIIVKLLQLY